MKMRKLLAILMALALVMSFSVGALAATVVDPQATGNLTISPVYNYNTVSAYKIISITQMVADDGKTYDTYAINPAYRSILISAIENLRITPALVANPSDSDVLLYITNYMDDNDMATVAASLKTALESETAGLTALASAGTITLSSIDLGYYLILDTTIYANYPDIKAGTISPIFVEVNTTTVNISLKTDTTTVPTKSASGASYSIGDTVIYTVEVVIPYFNFETYNPETIEYVITDTMGTGLTFDDITSVSIKDSSPVTSLDDYDLTPSTDGFTMTFGGAAGDTTIGGLRPHMGETLEIVYTATVNADAPTDGSGLINDLETGYIANNYTGDRETVYTYGIQLLKEDEYGNPLEGVEFALYTSLDDGAAPLTFAEKTFNVVGNYLYDSGDANTKLYTDDDGNLVIWGLAAGTYYLREINSLPGYNLLTDLVTINIVALDDDPDTINIDEKAYVDDDDGSDAYYDLTVINYTGISIPGTGGIGTTLFTIFGGVIILGAFTLLIANRKRIFGK